MSYEHKDTMEDSVIHYYDHVLLYDEDTDEVLEELDHVYARAAKADEYEAKAKAFDKYHATISSHLHLKSEPEFSSPPTEVLSDIIDIHNEYESGESNA